MTKNQNQAVGQPWTPEEVRVLQECRIIEPNGTLVQVYLERPEDKPLGHGPKVEMEVVRKLISADTTPDQRWLEWIFFQAGGGQRAKDAAKRALEQTRDRFIDERVSGFENPDTKEKFKPVPKPEAEARWAAVEPRWQEILVSADQDVVDHLGVFGYHRSWPGKDKIYSRVINAVSKFLRLQDKVAEMNMERITQAAEPIQTQPRDFHTLDDLEKAIRKVERYFASKAAREDIEVEHIYEDDMVRVICPLTYAASVRYGFDNWPFSNRVTFDEVLDTEHSFRDAWKSTTSRNLLIFWYWKVPMPSWISRKDSEFHRYELVNLAMEYPHNAAPNVDAIFHDEENAANMTGSQVRKMIADEPSRPPDPQDEEMPVKRGPNAYSTEDEAQLRLKTFDKAWQVVNKWLASFDRKRVKSDTFGEDKDQLG